MFYLVGFPRYDKNAMIIFKKSESYDELVLFMKDYKIGEVYTSMTILSDIYPISEDERYYQSYNSIQKRIK